MIAGIDLGTTNSLVAFSKDGEVTVVPNRLGEYLTPSVVSVDGAGTVFVGATARERGLLYPHETVSVFKRSMGTGRQFRLGEREFSAEELSSLVLKSLKEDLETYVGHPVEEAVISVPAYFNDSQRRATKRAGELAGFRVERIVSEPTAAALSYGINEKNADTKYLVFDLGGGTFDVSILEQFEQIMEVRAVAGDNFLGGEDFTDVLVRMFMTEHGIEERVLTEKEEALLRKTAEEAKCSFSEKNTVSMRCTLQGKEYISEIRMDAYERACQILFAKLKKPIERSLRDADIPLSEIGEILLVGGATRLPILRRFVSKTFGRIPNTGIDPDRVVAIGAAIQGAMKERNEAVREMILTDVCPFTLGTEVCVTKPGGVKDPGHYLPIIERNSVIPISRTHRVYTASEGQTAIHVKVLQGESRMAANNALLGDLEIPVPRGPEGQEAADITFTYDVNSILEVIVKVVSTGQEKRIVIRNEDNEMTDEEVDARLSELAELKIPPREQEENRYLMLKGDRLYEETVGDDREYVDRLIRKFEMVLDTQDREKIKEAREEFRNALEAVERALEEGE
ncbi:MAG: molecular chaperone HscC [Eubacterium sp.]|nr:molecular chaperone HscC [Eubacterium sp.]